MQYMEAFSIKERKKAPQRRGNGNVMRKYVQDNRKLDNGCYITVVKFIWVYQKFRNRHQMSSIKKAFLKFLLSSQENTCAGVFF